jgi:Spectrin repeat
MENWLQDQIRVAENTDCGIDSATLGVATADFSNFDKKVSEKGPRQMKMIEEEAEILKRQSPTTAAVVNKRLADLRSLWAELNDAIQRRDQLLDKMGDIFSFDDKVAEVTGTIQDTLAMCFGEEGASFLLLQTITETLKIAWKKFFI